MLRILIISTLTLGAPAAVAGRLKSELPPAVLTSFEELQPDASYKVGIHNKTKVYVLTGGGENCGSGGCAQVVFIEDAGAIRKAFDGLAKQVRINFDSHGTVHLTFEVSGLACNKADNASPCRRKMLWNGKQLIMSKR